MFWVRSKLDLVLVKVVKQAKTWRHLLSYLLLRLSVVILWSNKMKVLRNRLKKIHLNGQCFMKLSVKRKSFPNLRIASILHRNRKKAWLRNNNWKCSKISTRRNQTWKVQRKGESKMKNKMMRRRRKEFWGWLKMNRAWKKGFEWKSSAVWSIISQSRKNQSSSG